MLSVTPVLFPAQQDNMLEEAVMSKPCFKKLHSIQRNRVEAAVRLCL